MGVGGNNYSRRQQTQINNLIDINNPNLRAGNVDPQEIPDCQYLCPKCWRIPEILNIHSDNGHIVLKCTYHGILDLSIKDYYEFMKNSVFTYLNTKCFNCKKNQKSDKENIFKYCYECQVVLCKDCIYCNNLREEKEHPRSHTVILFQLIKKIINVLNIIIHKSKVFV